MKILATTFAGLGLALALTAGPQAAPSTALDFIDASAALSSGTANYFAAFGAGRSDGYFRPLDASALETDAIYQDASVESFWDQLDKTITTQKGKSLLTTPSGLDPKLVIVKPVIVNSNDQEIIK